MCVFCYDEWSAQGIDYLTQKVVVTVVWEGRGLCIKHYNLARWGNENGPPVLDPAQFEGKEPTKGAVDLYEHLSVPAPSEGKRTLKPGDTVSFTVEPGKDGEEVSNLSLTFRGCCGTRSTDPHEGWCGGPRQADVRTTDPVITDEHIAVTLTPRDGTCETPTCVLADGHPGPCRSADDLPPLPRGYERRADGDVQRVESEAQHGSEDNKHQLQSSDQGLALDTCMVCGKTRAEILAADPKVSFANPKPWRLLKASTGAAWVGNMDSAADRLAYNTVLGELGTAKITCTSMDYATREEALAANGTREYHWGVATLADLAESDRIAREAEGHTVEEFHRLAAADPIIGPLVDDFAKADGPVTDPADHWETKRRQQEQGVEPFILTRRDGQPMGAPHDPAVVERILGELAATKDAEMGEQPTCQCRDSNKEGPIKPPGENELDPSGLHYTYCPLYAAPLPHKHDWKPLHGGRVFENLKDSSDNVIYEVCTGCGEERSVPVKPS